jgi:beta-phosphoglucomutase-like phosphatase (HAD superfamily)
VDPHDPQRAAPPLDELGVHWRHALRAAREAIDDGRLPDEEQRARAHQLRSEIDETQALLATFGHEHNSRFLPIVVSSLDARRLLGLPPEITAIVVNLDGVLIGSAALHVAAWTRTFDEFLLSRMERTHGRWELFNPRVDYTAHLHARPRLAGVRDFLASRGIRLPDGDESDLAGAETVHGIANRKAEVLRRLLAEKGVTAFDGSRSYLELAHEAGIRCAVVSASANTTEILDRAGLATLVDERVDGMTIAREHLHVKPEPDTLLEACRLLGTDPAHAAAFETTRAGVLAGRRAGFDLVVGVDGATGADPGAALRAEGAGIVVHDVEDLLEQRVVA